MSRIMYLSWLVLALALLAWAGVGFFALTLLDAQDARAASASDSEQASARQSSQLRMHALARDTASARAELESLSRADIIAIAGVIEEAGKAAGVPITIGGVQEEGSTKPSPSANIPAIHALRFVVEAEGAFDDVVKTEALLQVLPLPSSIEQFDLEYVPPAGDGKSSSKWRLTARIRILTTSDVSS